MKKEVSVTVQNPQCPGVSPSRTFGLPALQTDQLQTQTFSEDAMQPRASSVQADFGHPDLHSPPQHFLSSPELANTCRESRPHLLLSSCASHR